MSYFRIFLGVQRPDVGLELDHFLCMDMSCDLRTQVGDGEEFFGRICRLRILGCYALFMLHNNLRYGLIGPDELHDAFGRFVRNGEQGMDHCCGLSS